MEMTYYKQYEPFFGSWSISKMLGEGSFGKVFEIERQDFGTTYKAALKIITVPQNESEVKSIMASGMDSANVTEYFEGVVKDIVSEFVLMSRLKGNSHVVSYEDHQVVPHENKNIGWDILIRMELLTPLLEHAQNIELTRKDVMRLGIDICSGLELCQKHNIIHRDIKPENIFVSESGNYKLGDFGIARTIEKTSSGLSKKGTYIYMAPEVYKGEEYGTAVDIYSLGIVMYRLLNNNRNPFLPPYPEKIKHSDIDDALIRRISGEVPPSPSGADGRLAEIVLKACSYNPKDRYSSPMQMRLELESILYEKEESKIIYPKGDKVVVESNEYATTEEEHGCGYDFEDEGTVSIFGNVPQPIEAIKQVKSATQMDKSEPSSAHATAEEILVEALGYSDHTNGIEYTYLEPELEDSEREICRLSTWFFDGEDSFAGTGVIVLTNKRIFCLKFKDKLFGNPLYIEGGNRIISLDEILSVKTEKEILEEYSQLSFQIEVANQEIIGFNFYDEDIETNEEILKEIKLYLEQYKSNKGTANAPLSVVEPQTSQQPIPQQVKTNIMTQNHANGFCMYCGTPQLKGAKFCMKCGTKVGEVGERSGTEVESVRMTQHSGSNIPLALTVNEEVLIQGLGETYQPTPDDIINFSEVYGYITMTNQRIIWTEMKLDAEMRPIERASDRDEVSINLNDIETLTPVQIFSGIPGLYYWAFVLEVVGHKQYGLCFDDKYDDKLFGKRESIIDYLTKNYDVTIPLTLESTIPVSLEKNEYMMFECPTIDGLLKLSNQRIVWTKTNFSGTQREEADDTSIPLNTIKAIAHKNTFASVGISLQSSQNIITGDSTPYTFDLCGSGYKEVAPCIIYYIQEYVKNYNIPPRDDGVVGEEKIDIAEELRLYKNKICKYCGGKRAVLDHKCKKCGKGSAYECGKCGGVLSKITGKCKICPNDYSVCMYCNAGGESGVDVISGICNSCGRPRKY